jgi:hypothetical protein
MQGRSLGRTQVLAWNEAWSFTDRECLTAALDSIPGGLCVLPPSGGYIGVWINNQRALVINPGYLSWPGRRFTEGLPPDLFPDMQEDEQYRWHELSTFRPHIGGPPNGQPAQKFCPTHGLALPLTGVCDDCG